MEERYGNNIFITTRRQDSTSDVTEKWLSSLADETPDNAKNETPKQETTTAAPQAEPAKNMGKRMKQGVAALWALACATGPAAITGMSYATLMYFAAKTVPENKQSKASTKHRILNYAYWVPVIVAFPLAGDYITGSSLRHTQAIVAMTQQALSDISTGSKLENPYTKGYRHNYLTWYDFRKEVAMIKAEPSEDGKSASISILDSKLTVKETKIYDRVGNNWYRRDTPSFTVK